MIDDILTTREAAKYLKISEALIRRMIRSRQLKAYKEGRRGGYRIPKENIKQYIEQKLKIL